MVEAIQSGLVYKKIVEIQGRLASLGIAKGQRNTQQNYRFRGIDDVYNALAPFLSEVGLCILPEVTEREVTERKSNSGGTLIYVAVRVTFAFICAEDGSRHDITVFGEAMDSGDKATNKAMSAAYKYACLQAFCIPTEGDNDADASSPRPAPAAKPAHKPDIGKEMAKAMTPKPEQSPELKYICSMFPAAMVKEGMTQHKVERLSQATPEQLQDIAHALRTKHSAFIVDIFDSAREKGVNLPTMARTQGAEDGRIESLPFVKLQAIASILNESPDAK